MKKLNLTKVIASTLVAVSVLALNPIGASADFIQNDNGGIWYREGNSWATGWRQINGNWYYFYQDGYARKGWLKDTNGKWYYLYGDGSMAKNTTIEGYQLGSDGAWVVTTPTASTTTIGSTTANNTTGIYYWDKDLKHMNYKDYYIDAAGSCSYGYSNTNKKVLDNLNNEYTNFLTLSLRTGYFSDVSYCYVEFPLNGEFKEFKSKLGLTKENQENLDSGKVKIYLDDEEVYDTELKSGDLLKDVDINLTGKKKIKFYFEGYTPRNYMQVEIGFFDGQFIK